MAHRSSDGVRNAAYDPDNKDKNQAKIVTGHSSSHDGDVTWKSPIELSPPSYEESLGAEAAASNSPRVPVLTEEEARDALLTKVKKGCCWGKDAAKHMSMGEITPTCSYHYVLETFTEGRSTCKLHVPYKGGPLDGPHEGPAHGLWDTPCKPTAFFRNEENKVVVPHTDVVGPCPRCSGSGSVQCSKCEGRCRVKCSSCSGKGKKKKERVENVYRQDPVANRAYNEQVTIKYKKTCSSCNGRGTKKCHRCDASGRITCTVCDGYGKVKNFTQLTVVFTNRHSDHIVEKSDFTKKRIRKVQGDTLFTQTQLQVSPIENFLEPEINEKSKELLQIHATSWPTEHVLQQRHYLRAVPVYECHFEHFDKPGRFWVYGHERKVYTKDYPHTCCCCRCTIL